MDQETVNKVASRSSSYIKELLDLYVKLKNLYQYIDIPTVIALVEADNTETQKTTYGDVTGDDLLTMLSIFDGYIGLIEEKIDSATLAKYIAKYVNI